MPVQADMVGRKQDMHVLTIRYRLILNFDEFFECAGKDTVDVMAELFAKFVTVQIEYYDYNNSVF
jgi:hypothetical protein